MFPNDDTPERPDQPSLPHPADAGQASAALPAKVAFTRALSNEWAPLDMPGPDQGAGDGMVTIAGFFHAMRRRWVSAIGLGVLLATLLTVILWVCIPVKYEAEALIKVKRDDKKVMSVGPDRPMSDKAYDTYRQTQSGLIKSAFVIQAALRKREISQLPMIKAEEPHEVEWLIDELNANFISDSEIMRISLKGEDQEQIKKIVNAIVLVYQEEIIYAERQEEQMRLDMLNRTLASKEQEYTETTKIYLDLAKSIGSNSAPDSHMKQNVALRDLSGKTAARDELHRELTNARMQLQIMISLNQNSEIKFSKYQIQDQLMLEPKYITLDGDLDYLKDLYELTAGTSKPGSRKLARVEGQISAVMQKMKQVERERTPAIEERLRIAMGFDPNQQRMTLNTLYTTERLLTAALQAADNDLAAFREELDGLVGASAELFRLESDLTNLLKTKESMSVEIASLSLEVKKPQRITVIFDANVPKDSDWFIKYLEIGGAWVAMFGAVVFGIALWDVQGRHVNTPHDVVVGAGLRVIGSLPPLDRRGATGILPLGRLDQQSLANVLNESIDSIRTALLYQKTSQSVSVVMITSACGQEGKTTVASQLATSLARSGRRTLLIDGDLRNPRQHLVFGLPFNRGLAEILRGEARAGEVIHATQVAGLSMMSAGYCDQASIRALANESLHKLIAELKASFDFVVIDSGPVLACADPLLLGQYADTSIISVRRDVSQIPKVYAAHDRLQSVGIDVMGAIVNGAETEVRRNSISLPQTAASHSGEIEDLS